METGDDVLRDGTTTTTATTTKTLRERAQDIVYETEDVFEKCSRTHELFGAFMRGEVEVGGELPKLTFEKDTQPSRPSKLRLVAPKNVPSAKMSQLEFNQHCLHNLAHIELNAVDFALDTVVRFGGGMPREFSLDFMRVADDESRHYQW